jgi:hypothetical protein
MKEIKKKEKIFKKIKLRIRIDEVGNLQSCKGFTS